ncbi:hypothetical protein FOA52_001911 [Chlamydomonas sp. UWO 241]|nr:hypothetical protein FOA52_001911 [Chlamydomonas sp. UWO 241]
MGTRHTRDAAHTADQETAGDQETPAIHKGSYEKRHDFLGDTLEMTKGAEAPDHHGTLDALHVHEKHGTETSIEFPVPMHEKHATETLVEVHASHPETERPPSPRQQRFVADTYKMVKGSEAPEHHGTMEQLHLHEAHGLEDAPIAIAPPHSTECAEGAEAGSEPPAKQAVHHHHKYGEPEPAILGAGAVLGPALGLTDAEVEMLSDPLGPEPGPGLATHRLAQAVEGLHMHESSYECRADEQLPEDINADV